MHGKLTIPKTMANAGASHISMEFGITGPSFTMSACSSAGHAIGQAYWMIRNGTTDLAITGGSEAPFSFGILMLVLGPLEAAQARGAGHAHGVARRRLGTGTDRLHQRPWHRHGRQ
jgi:acetyl-CoA acetyltransferase